MPDIDFVLTWVDGGDAEWQERYKRYKGDREINFAHYRDQNTLKYWFRAVERYAPWVRRIHFVTCGQTPEWLNTEHEKLHLVSHEEYMPAEYLPTFSANPIELNFHRIDGLAEQFVYFNDDTFITAPVSEEDFFSNGMPCDSALMSSLIPSVKNEVITYILFNDLLLINSNFNKKQSLKADMGKWLSPRYGKQLLKNLYYMPIGKFSGFVNPHLPNAFLKSTFCEVWEREHDILDSVSKNKFRTKEDVNQYLMRYWQIASGKFSPRSPKIGTTLSIGHDLDAFDSYLKEQKYKLICVNDDPSLEDIDALSERLVQIFEGVFTEKSRFEIQEERK